jgi:heavy metal sensor kinase
VLVCGVVLYASLAASLGLSSPLGLLTMHPVGGVAAPSNPEAELRASVGHLLASLALLLPLVVALAIAGGLFLAGRALDPIDRITRTAARIGAERDLRRRVGLPHTGDEVGRLAATFDAMLEQLERAFERERQFTADVAHELRTPLAALISQADVALSRRRSAEAYRQALEAIQRDSTRLAQLVEQMLQVARADAGQQPLVFERLDLGQLAVEVVRSLEPLAAERGVCLETAAGEAVWVRGDQVQLAQALTDLVDNGIRYVQTGGQVYVAVRGVVGVAEVRVADTGPGITAEHLPRLFDRFYRADASRAHQGGGAGLGLAICRWIIEAHGGQIAVQSELGRGTTFTVHLPLATPDSSD